MIPNEDRPFESQFKRIIRLLSANEKKIYIGLGVFVFLVVFLAGFNIANVKKIFGFTLFVIIGGVFKFLINKYNIWLEFTPIMFFCVIIAQNMGIVWMILYIFVADIMMSFAAGKGPTGGSVPYWLWMFLISIIVLPLPVPGFGNVIIPLLYFLGGMGIEQLLKGGLDAWRWASTIANFVINAYFFLKLSEFFVGMVI